jgi:hypothetical protein
MSGDILQVLLFVRNQVKIYHWQTMSFARHKATDDLVSSLDESIDNFTEVFMGKYGRPHFTSKNSKIELYDATDKKGHIVLEECIKWLMEELPKKLKKTDTDLLNIRDDIVGQINKTRYLFTLK